MATTRHRGFLALTTLLLATGLLRAGPTTRPTTIPAAATRPATAPTTIPAAAVPSLKATAIGADVARSTDALRQLAAAGDPGRAALREVLPVLLARDAATIRAEAVAAPAELAKLRAAEKEAGPLRQSAAAAIGTMTRDPADVKAVHRNYDALAALQAKLAAGYGRQARVLDALGRRAVCIDLTRDTSGPAAAAVASAGGDELDKFAEQALGMPPSAAAAWSTGPIVPPSEADRRGLWFHVTCRRIEAFNRTVESSCMNAGEIAHARQVNLYRELLGLPPYEFDARLVQAARRHCKEMVDLWYFAHWSPTPATRTPWARMGLAGYPRGGGENLHMGRWDGREAFWSLFDSPEHHREWARPGLTALGVGKWDNAWAEDFGAGPRLMLAPPDERAKAVVLGDEVRPQPMDVARKWRNDPRDIKFYDPQGREIGRRGDTPDAPPPAAAEMKDHAGGGNRIRWQPAGGGGAERSP